jgi:hypothetical protein
MNPVIIGSAGVTLLLVAFALNLLRKLSENSQLYLLMNFVGALMAAWYAYDGGIIPFVILEIVWSMAAFVKYILLIKKRLLPG